MARHAFLVSILVLTQVLFSFAADLDLPELSADVAIQGEHYNGDTFVGYSQAINQIVVRHASLGMEGNLNEYVEFAFRAGSATCLQGGLFTLMDAAVYYRPVDCFKAGFIKGEIKRGFEFESECTNVLAAEKPRFAKTFAPCHPTGFAAEYNAPLGESMRISSQLALLNGASSQNLDEEYDANLGVQVYTPVTGLAVGGFYTLLKKNYGLDTLYSMINGAGYRKGFGVDYDANNILFRSEYYLLKGFYNDPSNNTLFKDAGLIPSVDVKMQAFFIEGGYTFQTGLDQLSEVCPYARYQSWDKASNADGEHLFTYLTIGMTLGLGNDGGTILRFDYELPSTAPEGQDKGCERIIVRMQTDFTLNPNH